MLIAPNADRSVLIDRVAIAALIPHAGAMCLLDGVLHWDAAQIGCSASSHRATDNPLRRRDRLGIMAGVEYAAQAMALHGALTDRTDAAGTPAAGYLASLRALRWHVERLDLLPGALLVAAERLHGEAGRSLYAFALRHDDRILLAGRAAVVLA